MPAVFPFQALQFKGGSGDVSAHVAPPYDVLGLEAREALRAKDPHNIVTVDLPHVPAKELGPPQAYAQAASTFRSWIDEGALTRRSTPAMFAYRQTFEFLGRTFRRHGMAATVQAVPFGPRDGGGILPHEQTFSGPKEDRFALMKATAAQLSPIFGLHADDQGRATALVQKIMGERDPDMRADLGDGVEHEVWTVDDPEACGAYQDALAGEDIFIADGHHRYNTALNYLKHLEGQGSVPDAARRCMMVLVSMSDPGLAIGPTHRVLGGMSDYGWDAFRSHLATVFEVRDAGSDPHRLEALMAKAGDGNVLGLYDFESGMCATARLVDGDPLSPRFGEKPDAWRRLDVALIQHCIVEQICEPKLNGGSAVKWAFPHSIDEVLAIGSGRETGAGGGSGFAQVAVIVRPTPLEAVREISRANELMPQKSTYFYPKLATGLFVHELT